METKRKRGRPKKVVNADAPRATRPVHVTDNKVEHILWANERICYDVRRIESVEDHGHRLNLHMTSGKVIELEFDNKELAKEWMRKYFS